MPYTSAPTVLVAVGDELLSGHTQDTNSRLLATRLFEAGHPVRRIEVVADDETAIAAAIARALAEDGVRSVVVSGGIGPTPDDRTFAAVALAVGRPLELNPVAIAHIEGLVQRMHQAGWVETAEVSEANRRAAMVPAGATVLTNRRGMSPGLAIDTGAGQTVFVLPGIPRELSTILEEEMLPAYFGGGEVPSVLELRYQAVPEAEMDGPMRAVAGEFSDVSVGSYPQTDRRELVIRFRGRDPARVQEAAARFGTLRPDGPAERVVREGTSSSRQG
ncbi:MAG: competence/damage-inducible protein A [Candidatus Dormibacteraeota bacterium]|nr:competence/damage-inducible protein A [Candidatus Dormibacteraeota bacterium]MBV8445837.1 competence/damage-inducible protein A [Candidatus Dormibacteraeota bacterium]